MVIANRQSAVETHGCTGLVRDSSDLEVAHHSKQSAFKLTACEQCTCRKFRKLGDAAGSACGALRGFDIVKDIRARSSVQRERVGALLRSR